MGAEYVIARFFKLLVNKMFSTNLEAYQSTEASNVLISYRCSHVTSEDYILQVGQLKAPGTEPCSHPVYINMANRRTTPSSNLDCYSTSIRFRIDKQISQAREFLWFEWWRLGHQIILKQGPRRGRPGGGLSPPLLGHLVQTFDFLYERTHSRRHNAHKNVTFKKILTICISSHSQIFRGSVCPHTPLAVWLLARSRPATLHSRALQNALSGP